MADEITKAETPRARRRSAAAGGKAPPQSSIDDFLGGGSATLPPTTRKPDAPEPGGWVSDGSGVEVYDDPVVAPASPRGDTTSIPPPMRPSDLDAALSAPKKPGAPDLPLAYGRMVRTTFAFNPDEVFDELNDRLKLKKPVKDMGYIDIAEELDDAARFHRNASRLHAHAKVTLAEFEADVNTMRGDMRVQATNQLKAEKEEKGGKQITDGDVTARMAVLFPDEYRRQERLRAQAKAMVDHIENLVRVWELRRRELDTMLRECRKGA